MKILTNHLKASLPIVFSAIIAAKTRKAFVWSYPCQVDTIKKA